MKKDLEFPKCRKMSVRQGNRLGPVNQENRVIRPRRGENLRRNQRAKKSREKRREIERKEGKAGKKA